MSGFAAGAAVAAGLLIVAHALFPPRPGLDERILAIDRLRATPAARSRPASLTERVGQALAGFYAACGWRQRGLRRDLQLLDRSLQAHMATKAILAGYGTLAAVALAGVQLGTGGGVSVPVWLALAATVALFTGPDLYVRAAATARRRDLRRVLAAYLDWVGCCLAGGRGVPEALRLSARIGHSPALDRIRAAVDGAATLGTTPWQALGELGERIGVDELRDLAAPLGLVAEEGAKVRASLLARAETMRQRELAELEATAGIRSQTMILAQVPLFLAFLIYLIYPALTRVLTIT